MVKEKRVWYSDDVRQLCMKKDYYTAGTIADYDSMLAYVREHKPTKESLLMVAIDILAHSDVDDDITPESIANVMFQLERECVVTLYEYIPEEIEQAMLELYFKGKYKNVLDN